MARLPTLTIELVAEYLRRAVAEYGEDYIDPSAEDLDEDSCSNVYRDGGTGEVKARCIAAQVLNYHGLEDWQLLRYNNRNVSYVINALDVPVDNVARSILLKAQSLQDEATPWGQEVEESIAQHTEENRA